MPSAPGGPKTGFEALVLLEILKFSGQDSNYSSLANVIETMYRHKKNAGLQQFGFWALKMIFEDYAERISKDSGGIKVVIEAIAHPQEPRGGSRVGLWHAHSLAGLLAGGRK